MSTALVVLCLVDATILLEFPMCIFPGIDRKHNLKQTAGSSGSCNLPDQVSCGILIVYENRACVVDVSVGVGHPTVSCGLHLD